MKSLFYIFFFFVSIINSQNSDKGEVTYLDSNQKATNKENASYYEFNTPYKDGIFKYQMYFISNPGKAFLIKKFFYDTTGKKQGKYQSFRKEGSKIEEGYYKDDLKNGPWVLYWLKKEDSLKEDKTYLYKKSIYVNNLRNGSFKELYENDSVQGEGFYKNNNFNGKCKWYHTNGQISSLETYNNKGKLEEIKQWDENGVERIKKLKPNHGISSRREYIQKKIQSIINQKAKTLPNEVAYFNVLVDKQGKFHVLEVQTTSQNAESYKKKVKDIIENIKPIEPFLYHNQLINVSLKFGYTSKVYKSTKTTRVYKSKKNKRRF